MRARTIFFASVVLAIGVVAAASSGPTGSPTGFSHEQLEADRVMTERMSGPYGPEMDVSMASSGLLDRSRSEEYLRALEEHTGLVSKMFGGY